MTWFKVDDTLPFHAKVLAAGNPAMGLWVRAGAWSAQQLTDGFIPTHVARSLGTVPQARALVRSGLWVEVDGGYSFHEWSAEDRQPTRAAIETKREGWREKKRAQRATADRDAGGRFVSPGDKGETPPETPQGSPPYPVPSRPVPSRTAASQQSGAAPGPEFQNGGAVLAAHGMPQADVTEFVRYLKARGIKSWTAFVSSEHRKGSLDGVIEDWRTEKDASVTQITKRKGPNVGVEEWMLRG